MQDSRQRVRSILATGKADRIALYDLLRNDAIVEHFAGEPATVENGYRVVFEAYGPALDATRPRIRVPDSEYSETLPDGRPRRHFRWTEWTGHREFASGEEYAAEKRKWLAAFDPSWNATRQQALDDHVARHIDQQRRLGDVYLFLSPPCEWLTNLYHEVGLEQFVYHLADYPELIEELLEAATVEAVSWAGHLPENLDAEAVFIADDIAFHSGPLLNPKWMERVYIPRLGRIVAAYHRRGIKVLYHSDGNLYRILDALVAAGIDALNPIEVLAGMDVAEIHRRHPRLLQVGGIDVSQLLVFGTEEQIRDQVHRTIDAAEGLIMIGSTTEVHDAVPVRNFLAMREAALEYK
jgi:hypothetical protein